VGGARERKHPIHLQRSAMPHLAQECNRLQPSKTFFDALPFLLADAIARVLCGAPIDRAAASSRQVLRHVRRHAHVPALAYKLCSIETLVAAHGHAPGSWN